MELAVESDIYSPSIDDKGNLIPPASYGFNGGTMFIDEFKSNPNEKSEAIGCMLSILEDGKSSRSMARIPKTMMKYNDCKVGDGKLMFWNLNASWMLFTAKQLEKSHELSLAMLLSRTVPIDWNPGFDGINELDDNEELLFKDLKLKLPEARVVKNSEYLPLRNYVEKTLEKKFYLFLVVILIYIL
jgi:hypothetical protein